VTLSIISVDGGHGSGPCSAKNFNMRDQDKPLVSPALARTMACTTAARCYAETSTPETLNATGKPRIGVENWSTTLAGGHQHEQRPTIPTANMEQQVIIAPDDHGFFAGSVLGVAIGRVSAKR
jgi:hypothetical protein